MKPCLIILAALTSLLSSEVCQAQSWQAFGGAATGLSFGVKSRNERTATYYQYGFKNDSNQSITFRYLIPWNDPNGIPRNESGRITIPAHTKPSQISRGWFFRGQPGQQLKATVWVEYGTTSTQKKQAWIPGSRHPKYPNIHAANERNKWNLDYGYTWVNPGTSDLQVRPVNSANNNSNSSRASITFETFYGDHSELNVKFRHSGLNKQLCRAIFTVRDPSSGRTDTFVESFTPGYLSGSYRNPPIGVEPKFSRIKLKGGENKLEWWVSIYVHPGNGKGVLVARSPTQSMTLNMLGPAITADEPPSSLGTITTTSSRLTLECFDHGSVDGDIVNVYRNGRLLRPVRLMGHASFVHVNLDYGANRVTFRAMNEVTKSPNTARFKVKDENGRYLTGGGRQWDLSTGEEAEIIVVRQ